MLFSELREWLTRKSIRVFFLEILAIFIGITGSLLVDDWRQRQQDREVLEHLLQATHYNALQDDALLEQMISGISDAMQSSLELLYGDVASIADDELIRHFYIAPVEFVVIDIQPGYRRLLNTSLSIPFDHTMAELDYLFSIFAANIDDYDRLRQRNYVLHRRLLQYAGLPTDFRSRSIDLTDEPARKFAEFQDSLLQEEGYRAAVDDADAIRAALQDDNVRSLLLELVGIRFHMGGDLLSMLSANEQVINSIRRYDPNIPLPIGVVELSGDATSAGWSRGIAMTRDSQNPNLWSLKVTLTDGSVKFRADGGFASNWGVPNLPENRASFIGFEFGGDASKVFPLGTAEFGGLNIPVQAGTYDVTFNTQNFVYTFDETR